jgi:hypothetical protein
MHHNRGNNPDEVKKKYRLIRPLGDIPITGKHYCGNIEEQERHHHKGELSQHKGGNNSHASRFITYLRTWNKRWVDKLPIVSDW